jgi:ankyrin repeat protein
MDAFDHQGLTPMHYAMTFEPIFVLLQSLGGHIDTRDANGRTPLHWTSLLATHNFVEEDDIRHYDEAHDIAERLLRSGADRQVQDRFGKTPAELARESGHVEIADLIDRWGV